jgi:hypothetical protein
MVDEPFFYARIGKEYTACAAWREHALEKLVALKPEILLLGSAGYEFTGEQWIDGTTKILGVLSPAVGHIYILRDTPLLHFDGPDCLAEHSGRPAWFGLQHACNAPADDPHADQVYRWLGEAASRFANVGMLDMNAQVCPDGVCSAERDGLIVFRDSQHLTGSFAASLGPALSGKLGIGAPASTGDGNASRASPH